MPHSRRHSGFIASFWCRNETAKWNRPPVIVKGILTKKDNSICGTKLRPLQETDRGWARKVTAEHFGSAEIVSRGVLHDTNSLPGLVAQRCGERLGLLLYRLSNHDCEVVVLIAVRRGCGIGRFLLEGIRELAARRRFDRLWLVTTNDNIPAQKLCQKAGWRLAATYADAVARSRASKPAIPLTGWGGCPIRDELEFELDLPQTSKNSEMNL